MSVMRPNKPDSTPCIGTCSQSAEDAICRGCGRSVTEVLHWNQYISQQKIEVKAVAQKRIAMGRARP